MNERIMLQKSWIRHKEDPKNKAFVMLQKRVEKRWRREGEIIPDFHSPTGWDTLCRQVRKMRETHGKPRTG